MDTFGSILLWIWEYTFGPWEYTFGLWEYTFGPWEYTFGSIANPRYLSHRIGQEYTFEVVGSILLGLGSILLGFGSILLGLGSILLGLQEYTFGSPLEPKL
jgi:hypothetical protein